MMLCFVRSVPNMLLITIGCGCGCLFQALATEIILTLGEAFEVAYQVALHENMAAASHAATPIQNMRVKQPYSTAI
jgi:hypothetical protein